MTNRTRRDNGLKPGDASIIKLTPGADFIEARNDEVDTLRTVLAQGGFVESQ